MPITLEELEDNEATAPVIIGDQTGFATYRPYLVTPELEARVRRRSDEIGPQSALAEILCGLVTDWDIEMKAGEPVSLDFAAVSKVPTIILSAVYGAIIAHMRPGADEGKASGGASSNRQRTTRRHRGTRD